ncbi:hypothetical protein SLS62_002544 [Diatrype stigma]|uniref:Ubiquitin carrier protein n=1 Tax=Diatrype stigma TaxID=117547 RepID=A0AAN9UWN7_9PEZI
MGYTLNNIYPVLAMIEDPSPPAYEPVSLNDDDARSLPGDAPLEADEAARPGSGHHAAITSSLRAIHRTLRGISGWVSYFRGLGAWAAMFAGTMFLYGLLTAARVPSLVAGPISAVALLPLYTAWLHVVISAPSPRPFWRRLPPFARTFRAAAAPVLLYFLALELSSFVPGQVGRAVGLPQWSAAQPGTVPEGSAADVWKALLVFALAAALKVFLVVPAHVVLTRVQASLLPEEDETIVPFDRSFRGKLEPAVVGGSGYVSVRDAWATFDRASWVRLVKLLAKLFAVGFVVGAAWMAVVIPELLIILRYAKKVEA